MHLDLHETIVALSSAPGAALRAIVRLSGPNALKLAMQVFRSPELPTPARRGFWTGQVSLDTPAALLPADLYFWPGPRSYTGQDLVELHTLACPPLTERLIARLLDAGARGAQAGEFTLRGFLAGKIDLPRAEAVLAVIHAASPEELRQALAQLAGGVTRPMEGLREDLLDLLADVEAGLDFADEDLHFVSSDELLRRLTGGLAQLTLVQKQIEQRAVTDRPFRVVFVGRPNAGKSSLFNALAGKSAALVSAVPGTTRDYLVHRLDWHGLPVELVDTAGWRPVNGSLIESQVQQLSRDQAQQADLLLLCLAADQEPTAHEQELLRCSGPPAVLAVATKCDRAAVPTKYLATSALHGLGIAALRERIVEAAQEALRPALAPSLSRCRHHVTACLGHLREAHSLVLHQEPPELLALQLRAALEELGELVGAVYTDDLLDRIFSRFCIGK